MDLHDLTHAYRYSENAVMLKNGVVYAAGRPEKVITEET